MVLTTEKPVEKEKVLWWCRNDSADDAERRCQAVQFQIIAPEDEELERSPFIQLNAIKRYVATLLYLIG